jgi:hypothetical protein
MKRLFLFVSLFSLVLAAFLVQGCEERGGFTLLFTSDVKGWLTPAG